MGIFEWPEEKLVKLMSYPILNQVYAAALLTEAGETALCNQLFGANPTIRALIASPSKGKGKDIDVKAVCPLLSYTKEIERLKYIYMSSQLEAISKDLLSEPAVSL